MLRFYLAQIATVAGKSDLVASVNRPQITNKFRHGRDSPKAVSYRVLFTAPNFSETTRLIILFGTILFHIV